MAEPWGNPVGLLPAGPGGGLGVAALTVPGGVHSGGRPFAPPPLPGAAPQNPDWDVCSWCGKSRPGAGPRCLHCNIDRLRCPRCQTMLVGVRRLQVLVDLCMSCQGLWFERGRLELLLERLRSGEEVPTDAKQPDGRASLLLQLAEFLEATEPGVQTERNRGEVGIWEALATTFGSSVGGGKRVLYDMLTLLGELPGKPRR